MDHPRQALQASSGFFACITIHKDLPYREFQMGGARAWAQAWAAGQEIKIYTDEVSHVRTTKWENKLTSRTTMIQDIAVSDAARKTVFFRSPLCAGFSPSHLSETIHAIWAAGASVYIQTEAVLLTEGDSLDGIIEIMRREKKTAAMKRYRAGA